MLSTSLLLFVSDQVTGEANESQVCEALRRYRERECFVQEALVHLYNLVIDISEPRPDMLKVPCWRNDDCLVTASSWCQYTEMYMFLIEVVGSSKSSAVLASNPNDLFLDYWGKTANLLNERTIH